VKKLTSFLLSVVLLLAFALPLQAEAAPVTVWVEGTKVQSANPTTLVRQEQGVTLVAAEPLLKQLGFKSVWDQKNKVLTGTKEHLTLTLQLGSEVAAVNGVHVVLPAAPKVVDNSIYVPVRQISEAAGYKVTWDGKKKVVSLTARPASKGFMWKTQAGENTVYMLGSIHIANTTMYPLRGEIQKAFGQSDYLVVEADISKADTEETQQIVMQKIMYTDGTKLQDHISPEAYKQVEKLVASFGMPAGAFDGIKPWNIALMLDVLKMQDASYVGELGIDQYFLNQANASKLPILELESVESQLDMFNSFSSKVQEEMLTSSIANFYADDVQSGGIQQLSEMWMAGDDKQLLDFTESTNGNEEVSKAMLGDRNIAMAGKIKGYLEGKESKTYFVIVGAAHFLGDDGIVSLLEKEGFKVERQ